MTNNANDNGEAPRTIRFGTISNPAPAAKDLRLAAPIPLGRASTAKQEPVALSFGAALPVGEARQQKPRGPVLNLAAPVEVARFVTRAAPAATQRPTRYESQVKDEPRAAAPARPEPKPALHAQPIRMGAGTEESPSKGARLVLGDPVAVPSAKSAFNKDFKIAKPKGESEDEGEDDNGDGGKAKG